MNGLEITTFTYDQLIFVMLSSQSLLLNINRPCFVIVCVITLLSHTSTTVLGCLCEGEGEGEGDSDAGHNASYISLQSSYLYKLFPRAMVGLGVWSVSSFHVQFVDGK